MLIFLRSCLATLLSILLSRAALELENLALRHQIGVLRRSAAKRPKLTAGDRLLWICLSHLWRDWRSALAIVKPETVVAWHRAGFRWFWTWKVRHGLPGRPVISCEVREYLDTVGNLDKGNATIHAMSLSVEGRCPMDCSRAGPVISQSNCGH